MVFNKKKPICPHFPDNKRLMSLSVLCQTQGSRLNERRVLDIFHLTRDPVLMHICDSLSSSSSSSSAASISPKISRFSLRQDWLPFDPSLETKKLLISWLSYRGAFIPNTYKEMVQQTRQDFARGPFPPFKDFLLFNPRHVSTPFLQSWMATYHLSNGVEPRARSWWVNKALFLQKINNLGIFGKKTHRPRRRKTDRQFLAAFGEQQILRRGYAAYVHLLLAFDVAVLETMTPKQFQNFSVDIRRRMQPETVVQRSNTKPSSLSPTQKLYSPSRGVSSPLQDASPTEDSFTPASKNNTASSSKTKKNNFIDLASVIGVLTLAAVLDMGVSFISAQAKNSLVQNELLTKINVENIAKSAAGNVFKKEKFARSELNTIKEISLDEFANKYNIKFLTRGTAARLFFNILTRGNVSEAASIYLQKNWKVNPNASTSQKIMLQYIRRKIFGIFSKRKMLTIGQKN